MSRLTCNPMKRLFTVDDLEDWKVTIVDTGEETMTGGCLARVTNHVDDTFCFIYGDGVGDIEITH